MGVGDPEPFPLSHGVAVGTVVSSEQIAPAVDNIPGEAIFPARFFEEADVIVIGDEAYLLALPFLRDPQAKTRGEPTHLLFGHPSQGEKGCCELFLLKGKEEI